MYHNNVRHPTKGDGPVQPRGITSQQVKGTNNNNRTAGLTAADSDTLHDASGGATSAQKLDEVVTDPSGSPAPCGPWFSTLAPTIVPTPTTPLSFHEIQTIRGPANSMRTALSAYLDGMSSSVRFDYLRAPSGWYCSLLLEVRFGGATAQSRSYRTRPGCTFDSKAVASENAALSMLYYLRGDQDGSEVTNLLDGWIADLTREGVEANPGPRLSGLAALAAVASPMELQTAGRTPYMMLTPGDAARALHNLSITGESVDRELTDYGKNVLQNASQVVSSLCRQNGTLIVIVDVFLGLEAAGLLELETLFNGDNAPSVDSPDDDAAPLPTSKLMAAIVKSRGSVKEVSRDARNSAMFTGTLDSSASNAASSVKRKYNHDEPPSSKAARIVTITENIVKRLTGADDSPLAIWEWVMFTNNNVAVRHSVVSRLIQEMGRDDPLAYWLANSHTQGTNFFRRSAEMIERCNFVCNESTVQRLLDFNPGTRCVVDNTLVSRDEASELTREGVEPNPGPSFAVPQVVPAAARQLQMPTPSDALDSATTALSPDSTGKERFDEVGRIVEASPLAMVSENVLDVTTDVHEMVDSPSLAVLAKLLADALALVNPAVAGAKRVVNSLPEGSLSTPITVANTVLGIHDTSKDADEVARTRANDSSVQAVIAQLTPMPIDSSLSQLTIDPQRVAKRLHFGDDAELAARTLTTVKRNQLVNDSLTQRIADTLKTLGFQYTGPGLVAGDTHLERFRDRPEELARLLRTRPNDALEAVTRQHDLDYANAMNWHDLDTADQRAIDALRMNGSRTARLAAAALSAEMLRRKLSSENANVPATMSQSEIGLQGGGSSKGDGPRFTKLPEALHVRAAEHNYANSSSSRFPLDAITPSGTYQRVNAVGYGSVPLPVFDTTWFGQPNAAWNGGETMWNGATNVGNVLRYRNTHIRPVMSLPPSDGVVEDVYHGESYTMSARAVQLLLTTSDDLTNYQAGRAANPAVNLALDQVFANMLGRSLSETRSAPGATLLKMINLARTARLANEEAFTGTVGLSAIGNVEASYDGGGLGPMAQAGFRVYWPGHAEESILVQPPVLASWCFWQDLVSTLSGSRGSALNTAWTWVGRSVAELDTTIAIVPVTSRDLPLMNAVMMAGRMQYPYTANMINMGWAYNRRGEWKGWREHVGRNRDDPNAGGAHNAALQLIEGPVSAVLFVLCDTPSNANISQYRVAQEVFRVGRPGMEAIFTSANYAYAAVGSAGIQIQDVLEDVYDPAFYTRPIIESAINTFTNNYANDSVLESAAVAHIATNFHMRRMPGLGTLGSAAALILMHVDPDATDPAPPYAGAWGDVLTTLHLEHFGETTVLGLYTDPEPALGVGVRTGPSMTMLDTPGMLLVAQAAGVVRISDSTRRRDLHLGDSWKRFAALTALAFATNVDRRNEMMGLNHKSTTYASSNTESAMLETQALRQFVVDQQVAAGVYPLLNCVSVRQFNDWFITGVPQTTGADDALPVCFVPITASLWAGDGDDFRPPAASALISVSTDFTPSALAQLRRSPVGTMFLSAGDGHDIAQTIDPAWELWFYIEASYFFSTLNVDFTDWYGTPTAQHFWTMIQPAAASNFRWWLSPNDLKVSGWQTENDMPVGAYLPRVIHIPGTSDVVATGLSFDNGWQGFFLNLDPSLAPRAILAGSRLGKTNAIPSANPATNALRALYARSTPTQSVSTATTRIPSSGLIQPQSDILQVEVAGARK